ncbi:zinc finger protein 595 [Cephus cinctus]|uniref:Zinc finger protein 595 n=1 Tax=Cephus cinctus TaxID=211228 RepID=A0AAJ7BZW1_CEPCN|nr:zinc finger protein 595 [Cephus cinctus]
MGSLSLLCPMCCGESFDNSQTLKSHLLSMTNNLYCPRCSERLDSVMALIQHLDGCGHGTEAAIHLVAEVDPELEPELEVEQFEAESEVDESKEETEVLMEASVEQIDQGFLAAVNDGKIMIVGGSRTIQVDENGQIEVVEKMDTESEELEVPTSSIQNMEKLSPINEPSEEKDTSGDSLANLTSAGNGIKSERKDMMSILPDNSDLLNEEDETLMGMDHVNDVQELNDTGLLEVKQELCEIESEALYSCSSCGMSFNSVLEHIKQYHDGQEVVLEMAEQQLDSIAASVEPAVLEEPTAVIPPRQRQTMNTLRTEECVDSEGRLYTRKVVQIERFWDRPMSGSRSSKAPMIEKFFSNAEGVKVRDKTVAAAPVRMYRCNQCLEQFPKLGDFRVHACLRGTNRCDRCDQAFATARALQVHSKVHEVDSNGGQRVFLCSACGTEFSSHKSLRLHSRMHAPVRSRHVDAPEGTHSATFTCLECGKTLSESYRDAHMALHTGDSVTCSVCNRKFDSADSLAMHAAVHSDANRSHSPTPPARDINASPVDAAAEAAAVESGGGDIDKEKPYQCQHCGRRFTRPHEKVKHERIHTGEKPHACEVCGKTFRVSYCLTLHMRTHTGVRPYACQHCGKRFKASSVYNHHLLTHGEERAYTCPYCPKTFKTRVQLAGHKNSHTKPFRCTECSRPFASLYAARAHIQTHKKDNNLKFSCYICGASYGRAFALKDHLKQHGQDVLTPPEPAREEEVREVDDYLLAEEEAEDELVIPSPLPGAQSSDVEESD